MKALKFIIVLAVVAAGVAAPFWFHHRAELAVAAADSAQRDQAEEIARLTDENKRLARPPAPVLPDDQLKELLHLRNELPRLRAAVAETRQLRMAVTGGSALAPIPAGPNYWPLGQLSFAGYASPESTLKTALWTMKNGDMNGLFACLTPETLAAMHPENQKDARVLADAEKQFKEMTSSLISGTSGFRLLDSTNADPGLINLRIGYEGQGVNQQFILKKVGADWKIQDAGGPKLDDPAQ